MRPLLIDLIPFKPNPFTDVTQKENNLASRENNNHKTQQILNKTITKLEKLKVILYTNVDITQRWRAKISINSQI
ncbi:hypothetical protein GCM10025776_03480 [Corallincola platygyrae]